MKRTIDKQTPDAIQQVDTLLAQVRQQIAAGERSFTLRYDKAKGRTVLEVELRAPEAQAPSPAAPAKIVEVLPAHGRAIQD